MKRFRDKLELTYKSVRIRNIQRTLYTVQLIFVVVFSILILAFSGASLSPFYFPLDFIFFFLIVMLLVFSLESIVFRLLEIGYSKSESAIYLMAKNSLKKAVVLFAISAIILATPILVTLARGELSLTGTYSGPDPVYFSNRDRLALTETVGITVTCEGNMGESASVWAMSVDDFEAGNFGNPNNIVSAGESNEPIFYLPAKGYEESVLRITTSGSPTVTYDIQMEPSPFITSFVPLFALISLIAQAIWMGYLFPLMRRSRVQSHLPSRPTSHPKRRPKNLS
jgi:hypothetical protein